MTEKQKTVAGDNNMLAELRQHFGLSKLGTAEVEIDGFRWKLRPLNQTDLIYVAELLRQVEDADETATFFLTNLAMVAVATETVNDIPVPDVFDVPKGPSTWRRKEGARRLFDFLRLEARQGLGTLLYDTYAEHLDKGQQIKAATAQPDAWVWTCPKLTCDETLRRPPRRDSQGNVLPYYCPVHGVPMDYVETVQEEADPFGSSPG